MNGQSCFTKAIFSLCVVPAYALKHKLKNFGHVVVEGMDTSICGRVVVGQPGVIRHAFGDAGLTAITTCTQCRTWYRVAKLRNTVDLGPGMAGQPKLMMSRKELEEFNAYNESVRATGKHVWHFDAKGE